MAEAPSVASVIQILLKYITEAYLGTSLNECYLDSMGEHECKGSLQKSKMNLLSITLIPVLRWTHPRLITGLHNEKVQFLSLYILKILKKSNIWLLDFPNIIPCGETVERRIVDLKK